ncbi:MAG: GPW/gp25 family protein [Candidatus Pacebacteria bacterium]|jgi:phage baseplate assembly protein W|nr:GPW/gp25 family protein [Candidatus Paceibacterota bacterium]|tara:strand:- start:583 stop:978 length:396 start_codon:yes stop_codon:yes gene_type:complete
MPRPDETIFSDFTLNLTPHPVSRDLVIETNEYAVKRAVKNLIFTEFYERPYNPLLGSNVKKSFFEPFTNVTASDIEYSIREILNNYEPRIELLEIKTGDDRERNGLNIMITFRINNQVRPVMLDLFIERVR